MIVLLIFAVALFAVAVSLGAMAVLQPRVRRAAYLSQIGAYGYAGRPDAASTAKTPRQTRKSLDQLATSLGDFVAKHIVNLHEEEIQRELITAGFYRIGARRFLGYRALTAIVLPVVFIWLFGIGGAPIFVIAIFALIGLVVGWIGPSFV